MRIERLEIKGFGKLKDQVIELKDGLNVIYGGNEAGKSTLQAFASGMLYGLKNGRQGGGPSAPAKRYEPWDGGPFGGAMVYCLDNGKTFRVERNFKTGTVKLFDGLYSDITGDFAVGRDKTPLFAERQLGMDEVVFTRTVFIRQMELRLDEDSSAALAGRLANVSSSGMEDVSFIKAEKAITDVLKNGIGTGRTRTQPLDRLEARLVQLEEAAGKLRLRQEKMFSAETELQKARGRCHRLESGEKYLEEIRKLIELRRTLDGCMKKEAALNDAVRRLKELDMAVQQHSVISGSDATDAVLRRSRRHGAGKLYMPPMTCFGLAFACILTILGAMLAGVNFMSLPIPAFGIAALVSVSAGISLLHRAKGKVNSYTKTDEKTLNSEVDTIELKKEMICREVSFSCGKKLMSLSEVEQELRGVLARLEQLSSELESGIEASVTSEYDSQGFFNRNVLDAAIYDSDIAGLDDAWETENSEIKQDLLDASLKVKYCEGMLGDDGEIPEELQRVTEETIAVKEKIAYLKNKRDALKLALDVLNEASTEIRRNFAPDVNQCMSRIIAGLTAGKYTDLRGNDRLSLSVSVPESGDVRNVMSLSGGTEDQMYLALRLAMAWLLTAGRESLPLIFDEVFAQFDDRRTSLALQYLHNIYFDKQILLFTCKQREIELAQEIYGDGMYLVGLEYDQTAC